MSSTNGCTTEAPLNRADEVKDVSIFGKCVPNLPTSTPIYENPMHNHMANHIMLIVS
jgi:hypothetical protein